MAVRSSPLTAATQRSPVWSEGLLLIAFGIPGLAANIRYTVVGWHNMINFVLAHEHVPLRLGALTWRAQLVAMLVLGAVYTLVELRAFAAWRQGTFASMPLAVLVCWALVLTSDYATTVIGVLSPDPDAWAISRWLADTTVLGLLWSLVITFPPIWLIASGFRHVREGH